MSELTTVRSVQTQSDTDTRPMRFLTSPHLLLAVMMLYTPLYHAAIASATR